MCTKKSLQLKNQKHRNCYVAPFHNHTQPTLFTYISTRLARIFILLLFSRIDESPIDMSEIIINLKNYIFDIQNFFNSKKRQIP